MAAPNILCDTAGMTNAQWLAARMHGPSGKIPYTVGGSDVAAVFGVSPWTTPLELWMIKKGRMKPPAKSNANQLEMGHLLEPIAAHWYAKKTGNRVYEDTNLYQHADHPYALANFDRRFERASDGEPGILECKSCTYHKASEWDDGAIPLYTQATRTVRNAILPRQQPLADTWQINLLFRPVNGHRRQPSALHCVTPASVCSLLWRVMSLKICTVPML